MSYIEDNTRLLMYAAVRGDAVEVQRLIPISDPKAKNSEALHSAAIYGHARCVELLLPVSDLQADGDYGFDGDYGLQMAARNGHSQCVELLIPIVNPKANNSYALCVAVRHGHTQCVELLYPVSEPMVALQQLQLDYPNDYNTWGQLQQMVEAERVRNTLNAEVGTTTVVKAQRKM